MSDLKAELKILDEQYSGSEVQDDRYTTRLSYSRE